VRGKFDDINALITNVKKIFLKAPSRIRYYKEHCPNLKLPHEPVITRWGTWIKAVVFYCVNYNCIKTVILSLDDNAISVQNCKQLLQEDADLISHLNFVNQYFSFIPDVITSLQTQSLTLPQPLEIFNNAVKKLETVPDYFGIQIYIRDILKRNPVYDRLSEIANAIKISTQTDVTIDVMTKNYNFAPITSCDVERSFSRHKDILSSKRHNFTAENLEKYVVVYCNQF